MNSARDNILLLPNKCYAVLNTTDEIIIIYAGENCYRTIYAQPNLNGKPVQEFVDEVNEANGVTIPQRMAMEAGSMFGWEVPLANPENYLPNGDFDKTKLEIN